MGIRIEACGVVLAMLLFRSGSSLNMLPRKLNPLTRHRAAVVRSRFSCGENNDHRN